MSAVTATSVPATTSAPTPARSPGYWSGVFTPAEGEAIPFAGILGWAEEVHYRW